MSSMDGYPEYANVVREQLGLLSFLTVEQGEELQRMYRQIVPVAAAAKELRKWVYGSPQ